MRYKYSQKIVTETVFSANPFFQWAGGSEKPADEAGKNITPESQTERIIFRVGSDGSPPLPGT